MGDGAKQTTLLLLLLLLLLLSLLLLLLFDYWLLICVCGDALTIPSARRYKPLIKAGRPSPEVTTWRTSFQVTLTASTFYGLTREPVEPSPSSRPNHVFFHPLFM